MPSITDTTTYPNTAPALTDHVPGTDISDTTNDPNGEVVTFTMQAMMDLMEANMTIPTSVTAAGYAVSATLASTANGDGAALIGVEDSNGDYTATTVEGVLAEIATLYQPIDSDLTSIAALTTTSFGRSLLELANQAALLSAAGAEAADADILKADTADVLTAGFAQTPSAEGTKTTGTFTPDEANGNMQTATNGGAHTLAPPSNSCSIVVQYTNNGSAGAITTSGFTIVTGDTPTTTNGDDFLYYITKVGSFSHLHIVALQ